jgi:hypothetical protein
VELGKWGGREVCEFERALGILDSFTRVSRAASRREDKFRGVGGVRYTRGFLRL